MSKEDCYFFIPLDDPEEERKMSVLCVDCHDKDYSDTGWFWEGSTLGYGPFNYICCKCNKTIHAGKRKNEETKTTS